MGSKEFIDYVAEQAKHDFEYGVRDCLLFTANCHKLVTGVDILEGLPAWTNEEESILAMQTVGNNLLEAAQVQLPRVGLVEVTTPQCGDISVSYLNGIGYTFAICLNDKTMCCKADKGIVYTTTKGTFWGVR